MGINSAGYIIIKDKDNKDCRKNYKELFYGPLDKGSSKPSFCYPLRKEALKEEIKKMERALDSGYVPKEREMESRVTLKTRKERMDAINSQEKDAKKIFNENKDVFMKRRSELAEEIKQAMPSRTDVRKRVVNPHSVLKKEKSGLEDKKKEFIVLSRLAEEESNTTYLQRD